MANDFLTKDFAKLRFDVFKTKNNIFATCTRRTPNSMEFVNELGKVRNNIFAV